MLSRACITAGSGEVGVAVDGAGPVVGVGDAGWGEFAPPTLCFMPSATLVANLSACSFLSSSINFCASASLSLLRPLGPPRRASMIFTV